MTGFTDVADAMSADMTGAVRWLAEQARLFPAAVTDVQDMYATRYVRVHSDDTEDDTDVCVVEVATGRVLARGRYGDVSRAAAAGWPEADPGEGMLAVLMSTDARRYALYWPYVDARVQTLVRDRMRLSEPPAEVVRWTEFTMVRCRHLPVDRLARQCGLDVGAVEAARRLVLWHKRLVASCVGEETGR